MPRSRIVDEASYLAWYQMGAEEDVDGDGLDARREFLFGTDAAAPDKLQALLISREPLVIGVQRNGLAPDFEPVLWGTEDLQTWEEIVPLGVSFHDRENGLELLQYDIPPDDTADQRFFSFGVPD